MENILSIDALKENLEIEYVNSLILLLESFGEYKNTYINEIMFKKMRKMNKLFLNNYIIYLKKHI